MASLYWIDDALRGLLPTLWMTLGLGLPWAYALISSKQWHCRSLVMAVALAIGPAWMTAWMLVLGVIGASLNQRLFIPELIFAGSLVIAVIGLVLAIRKRQHRPQKVDAHNPLAIDEKLIISMIVIAVVIRWIHTAFWSFTAYDALWVYGFQGRLYFLEGFIPHTIDYYPQFVQLQYTYVQVMIGEINDHAARMVIPMMHIGSILAAYLLGERLINRRVGLFVATLWSLHPYVGQWSFIGDLEIPVTFSFTMASVFFLTAWIDNDDTQNRRHNAILAGLMLGIAMFTKPTAGAFIWGVLLLVAVELVRTKFQINIWRPRFMVAFWAGLASIPLGAIWYIRNIALGHEAITFPPGLWLTLARRSADHFNWIVLAIIVGFLALVLLRKITIKQVGIGLIGIIILLAGVLPSHPILSPLRFDPPDSYISTIEAMAIMVGIGLIGFSLLPFIRRAFDAQSSRYGRIVGWSLLLAFPYFATWFYSYSYHYRLGFAIIPLLILPTAIILSEWFSLGRLHRWSGGLRVGYYLLLVTLSIPGIISVAVDITWSRVWLTDTTLDSDLRKYQVFNPSLMEVYFDLVHDMEDDDDQPIIVAPGEQRLHFFFPQMEIIDQKITTFAEFDNLNATHFLYGTQAQWQYERAGIMPQNTQLIAALGRPRVFTETVYHTDATFRYELYEKRTKTDRFEPPKRSDYPVVYEQDIIFGDSLRFRAVGISPEHFFGGENILMSTAWEALQPVKIDYEFVIELISIERPPSLYTWFLHLAPHRNGYYAPTLWDVGETVHDNQFISVPNHSKIRSGELYKFRVRVYDPTQNRYLPAYIDGDPVGDFITLDGEFKYGK